MQHPILSLAITADNLVEIRDHTRAVGTMFGVDKLDTTRLITAVSELVRNVLQHARQGTVDFFLDDAPSPGGRQHVVARIADRGPGIADLDSALGGRPSGRQPAGKGLASSKRLADRFEVELPEAGGTVVTVAMQRMRGARALTAGDIDGLVGQLARRKPRSPQEEVEQQNREMVLALQALRDRQAELELADLRKNQFVTTLAHELRTPLSTLQMQMYLVRNDAALQHPSLVAHLAIMSRQAQQLNHLVNDLLDVSRVSQGKVELRKQPTDINELVSQAVEMTSAATRAKDHRVDVALSPEALWVDVDATRLKQVLSNVLHNAARYSSDHGEIAVRVRRSEANAVVDISDRGMGIAPELLPHVFGLFVQGSHHTDGGLGVGLALAQRLVHDHAGTITANSEGVGRGSRFTVTLPLCPPRARAASSNAETG